eukprot:TRINITY_DN16637_c0_g1_i10.p1 TRINITY_DN16637_c0_g1~~TRINITY_DN16637_c0_g1_i10.p1  ORF type:complete len:150 (-),score=24.97 TRINITY_DN16637_c0_g1_i10:322-771(-)
MSPESLEKYQFCFHHFAKDATMHAPISCNGAAKGGTGKMYAIGWRRRSVHNTQMVVYAKGPNVSDKDWLTLRSRDRIVHEIYANEFRALAPKIFHGVQMQHAAHGMPAFGHAFVPPQAEDVASDIDDTLGEMMHDLPPLERIPEWYDRD